MVFIANEIGVNVACTCIRMYIRNAEAVCYGFEKNAECRLRCGLQLRAFLLRYTNRRLPLSSFAKIYFQDRKFWNVGQLL